MSPRYSRRCARAYGNSTSCTKAIGVVVPSMSRRMALNVLRNGRREVRRTEADWLESAIDAAVGVVRRPARPVLEETNRADAAIGAEIEPVMRALRHANEIAGFDLDREHRTVRRVNVKQSAPLDDQTHF